MRLTNSRHLDSLVTASRQNNSVTVQGKTILVPIYENTEDNGRYVCYNIIIGTLEIDFPRKVCCWHPRCWKQLITRRSSISTNLVAKLLFNKSTNNDIIITGQRLLVLSQSNALIVT